MRFKIDENLPRDLVVAARAAGQDAFSVHEEGLAGASDSTIAKVVADERRVLVTLDLDFADVRRYVPNRYNGLIVLRLARQDRDYVVEIFQRVLSATKSENPQGKLWVVDEFGIRIRGITTVE